jgi:hypothetical protein
MLDALAEATAVDVAPTLTLAVATFTPGTLTTRFRGAEQQPLEGGGGGGDGTGPHVLQDWPTAVRAVAPNAVAMPAPASMCRHETLIGSLHLVSPETVQVRRLFAQQAMSPRKSVTLHARKRPFWAAIPVTSGMARALQQHPRRLGILACSS